MVRPYVLLNPGPTNVSDRVREAGASPFQCHREPEYFDVQDEVRSLLLEVLDLDSDRWASVLIAGSGTSAVEAMIASGVPEGKGLAVSVNGVYGDRIAKMARAFGVPVTEIVQTWEEASDPDLIAKELEGRDDIGALAIIHHETTTGLLNPVEAVGQVAKRLGLTYLVDSVSGLGGDDLDLEAANIDICAGTGGKNYQGFPALSFAYCRRDVLDRARRQPNRSVYLDLVNLCDHQDKRSTPFTPAVPLVIGLREALLELKEETVPARIARYRDAALFLREGYERLGMPLWLEDPATRSNCLTTVRLPKGRTYADLHDYLKERGFVIYAGQGKIEREAFRICNMGWVDRADYQRLIDTLEAWVNA